MYLHRPKHALGQIIKPRKKEERCHQYDGRTHDRSHLRAGTSLTVYPRASNRTIGRKRTGNKGTCEIRGAKSDKFSIWTDGVGITSSILLRCNDAVEKSDNGDKPARSCKPVIVESGSAPYTAVEVVSFRY